MSKFVDLKSLKRDRCIQPIGAACMDIKGILELLSGIVFFISLASYGWEVLKTRKIMPGDPIKLEPTKSTWLIWIALDTETFVSQCLAHTVNDQIIGTLAGGYFVLILALLYGKKGIEKNEMFCLAGAIVTLIALVVLHKHPVVAMSMSGSVVILGSFETFRRAYNNPNCEPVNSWAIMLGSCVLQLFAIRSWHATNIIQPLTFMAIESTMVLIFH